MEIVDKKARARNRRAARKLGAHDEVAMGYLRRRARLLVLCGLLVFGILVAGKLIKMCAFDHDFYTKKSADNHFKTMTISASRGTIYDANGSALAWSATVYNVYVDPMQFEANMEDVEKENKTKQEEAEKDGETAENIIDVDELKITICNYLAEKLEISADDVEDALSDSESRYKVLKKQIDKDLKEEIQSYIKEELGLDFIGFESNSKRYYPQEDLAAQVIGFTNGAGDGQYGLELKYDDYLSGVDGRIISAQAKGGEEMPYRNSTTFDAQDGDSLYLTLDSTIQYYLEKSLTELCEDYEVSDRCTGIIMNAKTGAIYAMATVPTFDLNNPSEISDPSVKKELASLPEDEYEDAYIEARNTQWSNKAISEINYPGSTFKIVTSSSAFEEDLIDLANDSFYCSGSKQVLDREIKCATTSGHGAQTFTQALTNSCNPAFMEIGLRLGVEKFSYYFKSFGLDGKTGIDLPGEVTSSYISEEDMSLVDLASAAFGQANEMSAIELITAYAAAINGGDLVTPYVVDHIVDSNGNVVLQNEKTVRRKVISEETSETIRSQLEQVVNANPVHNAYIQGYRIGGKSGTAEKLNTTNIDDDYVSSYCCFAPADDPEIIMLLMADYPNPEIGYYGGHIVPPYATDILEEVLPYLGFYPEYDDDYVDANATVPLVTDDTVAGAESTLDEAGLSYEVIGEGNVVVSQYPMTGTTIASNGVVYLYTEKQEERDLVTVPTVVGMTLSQASSTLQYYGLNYVATGSGATEDGALVEFQSETAESQVSRGTVVTLTFVSSNE